MMISLSMDLLPLSDFGCLSLNEQEDTDNDEDGRPPLREERTKTRYPSEIGHEEERAQDNQDQRAELGF
jgi:hypothetical protein